MPIDRGWPIDDSEAQVERLRAALRRAANVMEQTYRSTYVRAFGASPMEPSGEAVIALAHADMKPGGNWDDACARARAKLSDKS